MSEIPPAAAAASQKAGARSGDASDRVWQLGLAAVVALYVLIRIPLLGIPAVRDEGLFGVAAQAILRGETLYRDVFDMKPPGIFYIYALALKIFPATPVGLHLFLHLWNFAALMLVVAIAHELRGRWAALWSGWIYAAFSAGASIDGHTACTEIFLLLPVVASFWLALRAIRAERRGWRYWLASGGLGAAACWIKQPAAFLLLTIPIYLTAFTPAGKRMRACADYGLWLLGGLLVTACVLLAFRSVWDEFIYWSFTHSIEYSGLLWDDWKSNLAGRLAAWSREQAFPIIAAIAGIVVGIRRRERLAWAGLAFFSLSLASTVQSPWFYGHYFALTAPALALAGGIACGQLTPTLLARHPALPPVLAGAGLIPLFLAPPNYTFLPPWDAEFQAAAYLREKSAPDDWIFIYGSEPQILFLAERKCANPYIFLLPLMRNIPRHREFQHRAWDRITAVRPLYLVPSYTSLWQGAAGIDPFFHTQLEKLSSTAYHFETLLYFDVDRGKFEFTNSPQNIPDIWRLMEFWRRNEQ